MKPARLLATPWSQQRERWHCGPQRQVSSEAPGPPGSTPTVFCELPGSALHTAWTHLRSAARWVGELVAYISVEKCQYCSGQNDGRPGARKTVRNARRDAGKVERKQVLHITRPLRLAGIKEVAFPRNPTGPALLQVNASDYALEYWWVPTVDQHPVLPTWKHGCHL